MGPREFLEALFGGKRDDERILIWTLPDKRSRHCVSVDEAARAALDADRAGLEVYVGCGLRRAGLAERERGGSADVVAVPGVWADIDVGKAGLPESFDDVRAFLAGLPLPPTLVVRTGGGVHAWWLHPALRRLSSEGERAAAARLSERWRAWLIARSGWALDATHDLARVLRPSGTRNRKRKRAESVQIIEAELGRRYEPSELEAVGLPEGPARPADSDSSTSGRSKDEDFPPAFIEPILEACAFSRHCKEDAATLGEEEWYAIVSILARCNDGRRLVHEWSRPYPKYHAAETDRKIAHALSSAGPRTCGDIIGRFGMRWCAGCAAHENGIRSPIVLGRAATEEPYVDLRPKALEKWLGMTEAISEESRQIALRIVRGALRADVRVLETQEDPRRYILEVPSIGRVDVGAASAIMSRARFVATVVPYIRRDVPVSAKAWTSFAVLFVRASEPEEAAEEGMTAEGKLRSWIAGFIAGRAGAPGYTDDVEKALIGNGRGRRMATLRPQAGDLVVPMPELRDYVVTTLMEREDVFQRTVRQIGMPRRDVSYLDPTTKEQVRARDYRLVPAAVQPRSRTHREKSQEAAQKNASDTADTADSEIKMNS